MKTKKKPTQRRSRQTVADILEGAAHVLSEDGYDKTSTNLIAARAGVSIGSLYQYFPNKESVVGALIKDIYEADRQAIEQVVFRLRGRSFERLVVAVVALLLDRFAKRRNLRRVIFHEVPRTRQIPEIQDTKKYLAEVLRGFLTQQRGLSSSVELDVKLFILVNALEAVLYAAVLEPQSVLDRKILLRELKTLIIQYLRPLLK